MILIGDMESGVLVVPLKRSKALHVGYVEDYHVYINGEFVGEAENRTDAIKIATEAYRRTLQ